MELSTADFEMVGGLMQKLCIASYLANSLDQPGDIVFSRLGPNSLARSFSSDIVFSNTLKSQRTLFPSTFAKYHALRWKKLSALTPAQKNDLQAVLQAEIDPILEEARLAVQEPRTIHGEALPVDLGAWLPKLEDIIAAKEQRIKELQKEREELDDVREWMRNMKQNQDMLDRLETRAKRQKVSAV
jgi:hypothetical protein